METTDNQPDTPSVPTIPEWLIEWAEEVEQEVYGDDNEDD